MNFIPFAHVSGVNVQWPVRRIHPAVFFLFCLSLLLTGCSKGMVQYTPPASRNLVQGVPFHPQEAYQCGPASLAGVLNFYGDPVSPEQIAEDIFRDDLRGTVSLDMVLYARERGFEAQWHRGSVEDIVENIDGGVPLLVLVDQGLSLVSVNHYMVVVGYAPDGVIVNSGRRQHKLLKWNTFLYQWKKRSLWTLRITPADTGNTSG